MEQLLIIEDDIGLNQGLSKALKADDRQIISCQDLKTAKEQLLCGGVSLILLDINLPDGSGLELLREVKENTPYIPVILLTANDTDLDIVDGLERGADDYITKPFSVVEVLARIKANIRRTTQYDNSSVTAPAILAAGDLIMNLSEYSVTKKGKNIELTAKEFDILKLLLQNPKKVYTKEQIYSLVWNDAYLGDENAVNVHISRLRNKIEDDNRNPRYILTVWGIGYKLGDTL